MVQAIAAVLFVGVMALLLGSTAATMAQAMNWVEIAAYGGIALFGALLALTKARALIGVLRGSPTPMCMTPNAAAVTAMRRTRACWTGAAAGSGRRWR